MAGKCFATCLAHSGRMRFEMNKVSRLWKTRMFLEQREEFFKLLCDDIDALLRKAQREGLTPTVRLNGTSDIAWEDIPVADGLNIFELYKELQFIDYTKIAERMLRKQPSNYHLTYSINEKTKAGFIENLYANTRFNAAAVFANDMPKYHNVDGTIYSVISGDVSDLRHLDKRKRIVGLTYKLAYVNRDGSAFRPVKDNGFLNMIGGRL